jgi:hypothetical protein
MSLKYLADCESMRKREALAHRAYARRTRCALKSTTHSPKREEVVGSNAK